MPGAKRGEEDMAREKALEVRVTEWMVEERVRMMIARRVVWWLGE